MLSAWDTGRNSAKTRCGWLWYHRVNWHECGEGDCCNSELFGASVMRVTIVTQSCSELVGISHRVLWNITGGVGSVRGNTAMWCIHEWQTQEWDTGSEVGICTGSGNNKKWDFTINRKQGWDFIMSKEGNQTRHSQEWWKSCESVYQLQ